MLYYSMVFPYINYCNMVWASTHQTKLEPIYRLRKWTLRIICCVHQRHSSQPLFHRLGVLSFYQVNHLQIAFFVHSSLKRTCPPFFHDMFIYGHQFHTYSTRSSSLLRVPHSYTSQAQFSILYRGPKMWNSLPVHLLNLFLQQIKKVLK